MSIATIGRRLLPEWLRARWGWVVCAASFFIHVGNCSLSYTFGLFFVGIQRDLNATTVETGWIGSVIWGVQMFSSPIGSCLVSVVGFRMGIVLIVLVSSATIFVSAYAQSVHQLYLTIGVIHGLTIGIAWYIMLSVMVQYFPSKNSLRAVSFATMGSASAMLMISEPVSISIEVMGWRPTLHYVAAFTLAVALPASFLLFPPDVNYGVEAGGSTTDENLESLRARNPESKDDTRDASSAKLHEPPVPVEKFRQDEHPIDVAPRTRRERWKTALSLDALFFSIFTITSAMSWSVFVINIASYYDSIGLDTSQVAALLTITCALELATKFALATLGERFPYKQTYLLLIKIILMAVVAVMITLATSFWYLVALSIAIGILRACYNVLLYICCIETFGKNCSDEAIMIATVSRGLGFLTGTVPAGAIYDATGSYHLSFLLVAGICTLSAIALSMVLFCPVTSGGGDTSSVTVVYQARIIEDSEGCSYSGGRHETSV